MKLYKVEKQGSVIILSNEPNNIWQKPHIDAVKGGEIFENWLYEAKAGNGNLLVICGAGISMAGTAPGPSGYKLGEIFENYLRDKYGSIPSFNGDIAKAYEYYCYGKDRDITNPTFDQARHDEFVRCITASEFLTGAPNYEHLSLDKEARSSDKIRVYSVNVDQFFEQAVVNPSLVPWVNITTNAYSLRGLQSGCNEHRNWCILAAHGKTNDGPSVWSETVLSKPLSSIPHAYDDEKSIVEATIDCINNGPVFKYIIFAGICAPLVYLMEPLGNRLDNSGISWMWINPSDPPQDWLLNEAKYDESNGEWLTTTFQDACYNMHLKRYTKWFNNSCHEDVYNYNRLCSKYGNGKLKTIVKGIHRARRLFKDGAVVLNEDPVNTDRLQSYHQCVNPYDPPIVNGSYLYEDSNLAQTLRKFCNKGMRLTYDPGDKYPKCSIAVNDSDNPPTSLHMIQIGNRNIDFKNVAKGLLETMSECSWNSENDPDLLHFMVIDSMIDTDVYYLNLEFNLISSFHKCKIFMTSHTEINDSFPDLTFLGRRPARP